VKSSKSVAAELVAEALSGAGKLSLATLVERFVPIDALRALATRLGLSPKGYRIERAPPKVLVSLLTDIRAPAVVEEVVSALVERLLPQEPEAPAPAADRGTGSTDAMLRLREQELAAARTALERARGQAARQRQREAELERRLEAAVEREARLRREIEDLHRQLEVRQDGARAPRDQQQRIRALEREIDALGEAVDGLRRLLALRAARMREYEAQIADLEERVPKGRRRKPPPPEEPSLAAEFRLPHFIPSFYRSLEDRDRRAVGRVMQAVLLFCTEGPGYPGLEVKQIEGQDLWSMRASLKLRVYFRFRDDGDIDVLAIADREDQHTMLRRLKER
jgi:hypothetical protein